MQLSRLENTDGKAINHLIGCVHGGQVDDWQHASKMLNHLEAAGLCPVAYPPVGRALCGLIRKRLEPLFAALTPQGVRKGSILNRKVLLLHSL